MKSDPIQYYNRYSGEIETEHVYGEKWLRWIYETPLGKLALHALVKRAYFSQFYGWRMDQPKTAAKIAPFIRNYQLDVDTFLDDPSTFKTFNDFFYRKLKPEARPLCKDPGSVVFPADGRHLGFQNLADVSDVFVKGQRFDLKALLGSDALAEQYRKGSLVLSRLCPVDYHRFHFPVAGVPGESHRINKFLYSVSPYALRQSLGYLWENTRVLTKLETDPWGTVLILEVGATCVGRIQQTYTTGKPVPKGAEKGYFAFGGSTTITIFEPGCVTLAEDLVSHTAQQRELYAHMGDTMGHKSQ